MKHFKKLLAILLAFIMVFGLAATTTAADEDVTLKVFKENGTELGASESVMVGDKILVKMYVNKDITVSTANFSVWFDKSTLSFSESASSYAANVESAFSIREIALAETINDPTTEEQEMISAGYAAALLTVSAVMNNATINAGEYATLEFTALKAASSTQIQAMIREVRIFTDTSTLEDEEITGLTAGAVSLTIEQIIPVTGIVLNTTEMSVAKGRAFNLRATVSPSNATNPTVTWKSSDESIATVSATGRVGGVAAGEATITATAGDYSAECKVTVFVQVTQVTLSESSISIKEGGTAKLTATLAPEDADQSVTWMSSDESIATVENGVVTAIAEGTATITATSTVTTNRKATCTVTVIKPVQGEYTVSMAPDISGISAEETVVIPVNIGHKDSAVTAYNAIDITFSYDPEVLEFASSSASSIEYYEVSADAGTIRVKGCGAPKPLGEAFNLKFTVLPTDQSETLVKVTAALVDTSDNELENAADAQLLDPDTKIGINVVYTVTLDETVSSTQGTSVEPNTSYTFVIKDYSPYYTYKVTANMNGDTIYPTDNGDGTYTIDAVTGNVTVNKPEATPKSFEVVLPSDMPEVSGEKTATYGTAYTFTVAEDDNYDYTVSATIAEGDYTLAAPVQNVYTIPGTDVTGNIVITVTKTEKDITSEKVSVTFIGTGATGNATAIKGTDYSFTVTLSDEYVWEVNVTIDGVVYTAYTVSGSTYTIPGEAITGNIVIEATEGNRLYTVHFIQTNPSTLPINIYIGNGVNYPGTNADIEHKVEEGSSFEYRFQYRTGFYYEMVVTMGGTEITPEVTQSGRTRICTIDNVTGDIIIRVTRYMDLEVHFKEFVQVNGKTVYLVIASNSAKYGFFVDAEKETYRAAKYDSYIENGGNAYAYLIIVDGTFGQEEQDAYINELKYGAVISDINGKQYNQLPALNETKDVNGSSFLDINDAQLTYDIYSGKYETFDTVTMLKFLQADVNADTKVDVSDAAAVVAAIP